MYNNKNSSDSLAALFAEKVNKAYAMKRKESQISKTASEKEAEAASDSYESDAKDILISTKSDSESKSDSMSRVKKRIKEAKPISSKKALPNKNYSSYVNKNTENILSGLGKIAGSLKNKGEYFAADVVELTAKKIHLNEIKKFEKKSSVINKLKKMASKLDREKDHMSADVVRVTINKIINS